MKTLSNRPSKRQAEILEFIEDFQTKHQYSPSLSEIADNFSVSIPTVHQHIAYLKAKKLLTAPKGKRRSIETISQVDGDITEIPLLGYIAAGGPIEPINNPEPLKVPKGMVSDTHKHYALRVTGTSMIEESISDGDIIIVREQPTVENGEKAVAYLPDRNEVTLKKMYREDGRIKLVPANKLMEPFFVDNIEIQGKVVGVVRNEV